jgi:hypothetical protein
LTDAQLDSGVYAGIPAKKVKEGTPETGLSAKKNAEGYMKYKEWFLNNYEDASPGVYKESDNQ